MRAGGRALGILGSLLLSAGLSAGLLAGCSGSDDPDVVDPSTTQPPSPGEVVDGGTMRMGIDGALRADPARANLGSPTDMLVLDLLHDGLTRLAGGGIPAPALALDWTPDATLTTWVFHLDPAATFTSGRAVTAADVIASLERVAKGGDSSLAALRLETIGGFRPFVDGTAEHLSGLSAPDPATVQITLDTPLAVLPVILASPPYGVVDVASLEAATGEGTDGADLEDLDLAGRWEVAEATDDVVTLERRDGAPGHLDAVELRSYSDGDRAYDAFEDGDVDWALVPVDRHDDAVATHGDDHFEPFHAELFFGMNVSVPSLANGELRKAIAAAIDGDAIVAAVYPDLADPLATVVPAGVPGHDDDRCADCGHDPTRAKAILAAAFPAGGVPTVAIDYDQSDAQHEMARMVAADLEAVGIPSTLRPKPLEEYKAFVVSGAQELFSFGWIGGYVSPDAYLAPLFGSTANDNLSAYGSADVDTALAAARASADPALRAERWGAVEAKVLAEAVVVPIAQFRIQAELGERVQGFQQSVDGTVDWDTVWLVP